MTANITPSKNTFKFTAKQAGHIIDAVCEQAIDDDWYEIVGMICELLGLDENFREAIVTQIEDTEDDPNPVDPAQQVWLAVKKAWFPRNKRTAR